MTWSTQHLKIFDWCIAKSIEFVLVEILRFVRNSPLQTPKIVKLRHFYVIVIQKNTNVTSFRKHRVRKTLKIDFYSTLRTDQNCTSPKKHLQIFKNHLLTSPNRQEITPKNGDSRISTLRSKILRERGNLKLREI
jgi:hypothetical protein